MSLAEILLFSMLVVVSASLWILDTVALKPIWAPLLLALMEAASALLVIFVLLWDATSIRALLAAVVEILTFLSPASVIV